MVDELGVGDMRRGLFGRMKMGCGGIASNHNHPLGCIVSTVKFNTFQGYMFSKDGIGMKQKTTLADGGCL